MDCTRGNRLPSLSSESWSESEVNSLLTHFNTALSFTDAEAAVDRLLSDLAEEKQARATLERGTQDQAVEFLSRLEKLQR